MSEMTRNLKYSLRSLLKNPTYTLSAVLALALGIGANTAIFSLFETAMLNPLPVEEMDELAMVWMSSDERGDETAPPADYLDWRESATSFEQLAAYCFQSLNMTGRDLPEKVEVASVTENFFPTLGIGPMVGRGLARQQSGDEARVVVLSHGFWQRRFQGDREIVGQELTLDGTGYTVTGIMPPGFDFPDSVDLWVRAPRDIPLLDAADYDQPEKNLTASYLRVLGRLDDGVTLEAAGAEMATIAERRARELPDSNAGLGVSLQPLREHLVGDARTMLLVLLGGVGIVLLIACVNVANLTLARGQVRRREMAMRAVLGAGRGPLLRQLLTESVLLALAAGVAGLLAGIWVAKGLSLWLARYGIPQVEGAGLSLGLLLFTLGLALVTGVAFGLAPALQLSRTNARELLGGTRSSGDRAEARWRAWLVGAQIAVVVVLLVGAGLTIRSFLALQQVEPGFDPEGVVAVKVFLPTQEYAEGFERAAFFQEVQQRAQALPGVAEVAAVLTPPMANDSINIAFNIEGQSNTVVGERPRDGYQIVLPGYFRTLGIPVLAGRDFSDSDGAGTPGVVVISESMAERYWPGQDPIGQRITYGQADDPAAQWLRIIGVVGDVSHDGLTAGGRAEVYQIHGQAPWPFLSFVLQAEPGIDPMTLVPALRGEIAQIDPAQPVSGIHLMEELVQASVGDVRVTSRLLAIFAALALALAAVGIYGVLAYGVNDQRREIGIRIALGSDRPRVLRRVMGQGLTTAVVGVVVGLVLAALGTRLLQTLLYGVATHDPLTFVVTPLVLLLVAALASFVPAYQATRISPTIAMKAE